jgi:hypothetical protein
VIAQEREHVASPSNESKKTLQVAFRTVQTHRDIEALLRALAVHAEQRVRAADGVVVDQVNGLRALAPRLVAARHQPVLPQHGYTVARVCVRVSVCVYRSERVCTCARVDEYVCARACV